jgi:hypothetical protein
MLRTTWPQVLAWRLGRQGLDPVGGAGQAVEDIVERLCGVQAQVPSAAAQALAVRQAKPDVGSVDRALADRRLLRTWAMRGTLHLLRPADAGAFLAVVAAGRSWEKPIWTKTFGPTPDDMRELVAVVRDILDDRVLTREELVTEIGERLQRPDLEDELRSGWGTVLKPIAWQGGLCYGPSQGTKVTFTRPDTWYPDWGGVPEPDEAAATVLPAYLRVYAPASPETFDAYMSRNSTKKAQLRGWFAHLGDAVTQVDVDGEQLSLMADDVDALAATQPSDVVRLLPAFDQWVLGPGTKATPIVPAERRADVSRPGGWISPVVIHGGRVVGVWDRTDDGPGVRLFDVHDDDDEGGDGAGKKNGMLPPAVLDAEIARVGPLFSDP